MGYPWLVHWDGRESTKYFCPALAAVVGPVQYKILFRTVHFFTSTVPIAQQAGQAVLPDRLSLLVPKSTLLKLTHGNGNCFYIGPIGKVGPMQ